MDLASIIGIIVGLGAVMGGALLEGLHLGSITQPTAAVIVVGGTLGATVLSFPLKTILAAGKAILKVILEPSRKASAVIAEIVGYANKVRKEGLISLESQIQNASDEFLKKALSLAVDGTDPKLLRETMEIELNHSDHIGLQEAKVFEAAGGFAPTVGIIGAVLGLIHVMENLADPSKLGAGIAVAFVATVYGVSIANLLFLPFASKLRTKHENEMALKEMMLEGVVGILEGMNPRIIEEKLTGYLSHDEKRPLDEKGGSGKTKKMAA